MNFKNHIHTKIRNLFSSWLLPARRIHIEFIIESDKVSMHEIAEIFEVSEQLIEKASFHSSWL